LPDGQNALLYLCRIHTVFKILAMKRPSNFTIIAGVASLVLLIAVIAFSGLFAQSPLGSLRASTQPNPQAIVFVPQQAAAMATLLVNPDRLKGLQSSLASPDRHPASQNELNAFRDGLLGNGLSYQRDVQPWLGDEITLAVTSLDFDRDGSNGNQAGYLMALTTKDAVRSREFLQLFWQQRSVDQNLAFEQYQGTQIIYGKVQTDGPALSLASAVIGKRFVLFANSPKVLRDAINNVQAVELNLGSSADYQRAIAALPNKRMGLAYLNLPQLATLSGDTALAPDAAAQSLKQLAIGLTLDRQGLIAHTVGLGGGDAIVQLDQATAALRYLPQQSPVAFAGSNLAAVWPAFDQSIGTYRLGRSLVQAPIAQWAKDLPLNLNADSLHWVQGRYAFGRLPAKSDAKSATGAPNQTPTADWVFVVDKASNPNYADGLAELNTLAKTQGLVAGPVQVGAQTVSAWTQLAAADAPQKLEAKAIAVWADLPQDLLFASSIAAMEQALAAPKASLLKAPNFNRALNAVNRNNVGYVYADWAQVKSGLAQRFPIVRALEWVARPLFQDLKSVTLTNYGGEADLHRGAVLFQLR
jgi:hypothetical protein